jgi:hypothetical protein
MSTLLQLLKPNSGLGKVIRDPWKMSRTIHQASQLWAKWSGLIDSTSNLFRAYWQNTNDPRRNGYSLRVLATDTWYTLANVTNAKGGYLNWICLPSSVSTLGNTVEVRITVDGREYTFDYTNSYSSIDHRPFIGNIMPGKAYNSFSDTQDIISQYTTNNTNGLTQFRRTSGDNQWVFHRYDATIYNPTEYKFISQLRYDNTISVEVKMSGLNSDIDLNYALASISATI